ncbi:MAG: DUF6483 family protein [Candidatus Merdivicinus sp.]|jgi:hypothetical protein
MYQQDWLMRQIEQIVQALARILLGKDTARYEQRAGDTSEAAWLHAGLRERLAEGRVKEAAALLRQRLNPADLRQLETALEFYQTLNEMEDGELEAGGFSRAAVQLDLQALLKQVGLEGLL